MKESTFKKALEIKNKIKITEDALAVLKDDCPELHDLIVKHLVELNVEFEALKDNE